MMASEDPIVEVPMVLASSWLGALKSLAIMLTHPVRCLAAVSPRYGMWYGRTVLDIGANGVLFVVDEVLREGVAEDTVIQTFEDNQDGCTYTMSFSASSSI
jgi:hypothetical protein